MHVLEWMVLCDLLTKLRGKVLWVVALLVNVLHDICSNAHKLPKRFFFLNLYLRRDILKIQKLPNNKKQLRAIANSSRDIQLGPKAKRREDISYMLDVLG